MSATSLDSNSEARRNARRQKILQNADKRMRKVLERDYKEDQEQEEESRGSPKNESYEESPLSSITSGEEEEEVYPNKSFGEDRRRTVCINEEVELASVSETSVTTYIGAPRNRLRVIVMLGLLVRGLLHVMDQSLFLLKKDVRDVHLNKVFTPWILFEMLDFYLYRQCTEQYKSFLLLMVTLQLKNAERALTVICFAIRLFQDFMLYFFTFCLFDILITTVLPEQAIHRHTLNQTGKA